MEPADNLPELRRGISSDAGDSLAAQMRTTAMEFANKMAALGADHVMVFGGFVGEENVTYTFVIGNGNAFSQVGHVRSWLRKREYDLSYDDGGSDPDSEWAG